MKKRILSLLLAFLMVVGMIPAPAFATDGEEVAAEPTQALCEICTQAICVCPCGVCNQIGCTNEHTNWCDTCKKDNCGVDHSVATETTETTDSTCVICGTANCNADHTNWCDTCRKDNCGMDHSVATETTGTTEATENICATCSTVDCTTDHTNWCDTCKLDNCGVDHSTVVNETTEPEQSVVDSCPYCEETTAEDGAVTHGIGCTAAYVYDGSADVDKYAQLIQSADYYFVSDSSCSDSYGGFFYSEFEEGTVFHITGWYWDPATTALWYQVEFYSGGVIEEAAEYWPDDPWILQDYTDETYEYDPALEFVTIVEETCPICCKTDCETDHKQCEICEEYDCTKIHFWCDYCVGYDCDKAHLICPACDGDVVDCDKVHTFCPYCNDYDCGIVHDNEPVTAPVIPSNPTLTPGADVSIVDEYGDPVMDSFVLYEGMKSSISAWSDLGEDVSYQWQVCVDGQWIDVQGQTNKGILVSPAMFLSIAENSQTEIRCVVTKGEATQTSAEIPVSIMDQPEMASFALRSGASAAAETDDGEESGDLQKVNLIIEYKFSNNTIAANPWTAELSVGSEISDKIKLPIIPGYLPAFVDTDHAALAVEDGIYYLQINYADGLAADTSLAVTYQPTNVNVTVLHYWQNVDNDNYTLHETEYEKILTDSTVGDVHNTYAGFYNLLYEKPVVAADGSTVVEVYYDRYYYLMKFDLSGGYGVDPIYARYGASVGNVGTPTRAGYAFQGWQLNGAEATIPDTMPDENQEYVAQWQAADTAKLTVFIWGENADNNQYSVIETQELSAVPGATVTYDQTTDKITGVIEHTHTVDCGLACGHHTIKCYDYSTDNPSANDLETIQAIGNGEPESGYVYTIQVSNNSTGIWYKLYVDGKWYGGNQNMIQGVTASGQATRTFSGVTYTAKKYLAKTTCTHTHTIDCYDCSALELTDKIWEFKSAESVTVAADGSSVLNIYFTRKQYELKFYYAASVESTSTNTNTSPTYYVVGGSTYYFGKYAETTNKTDEIALLDQYMGSGKYSEQSGEVKELPTLKEGANYFQGEEKSTSSGYTYYYISFSAKYGANIYDLWPADVFNSVVCYNPSWLESPLAYVSAWNGEYNTYYSQHNSNQTIKGKYAVLDDNLLWDYAQFNAYADDQNNDGIGEVAYLCFWENGAGVGWSIPKLFQYKIYVEAYEGMDVDGLSTVTWPETGGKTYYYKEQYDTIDDSDVKSQTYPEIQGFQKVEGYFTAGNDGKAIDGTYKYEDLIADTDYKSTEYSDGFAIYFIYDRETYNLEFYNGNGLDGEPRTIMHEAPLASYYYEPTAPKDENGNALYEDGSYRFAGWYDNPTFAGDAFNFADSSMPAENIILYAKWIPITHTVKFYLDKAQYEAGVTIPTQLGSTYERFNDITISHGYVIDAIDDPGVAADSPETHPYKGYTFDGWFYIDPETNEEKAFIIGESGLPVTHDLNLYAKWSSNVLRAYTVYFVLDEDRDGVRDENENTYVANPITGSTLAGNSKTFEAKGDTALYTAYQSGYYPNVVSHTIVVSIEDGDNEGANTFTFLYTSEDPVSYTVKYRIKGTDTPVPGTKDKTVNENTKAVVTENFVPVSGYMPDAYQKTLVITPGGENTLIFWYTKDELHALYQINHYIQNVDGATWTLIDSDTITGDIGTTYSAAPTTIAGFSFNTEKTDGYNVTQKINGATGAALPGNVEAYADGKVTGTLTSNGMQLNLYYTRNEYPYQIYFLEYGSNRELKDTITEWAVYGKLISHTADSVITTTDEGIEFELYDTEPEVKTMTIKVDELIDGTVTYNKIVFYYKRCTQDLTITKVVTGEGANTEQAFDFTVTIDTKYSFHQDSYACGDGKYLSPVNGVLSFSLKNGESITLQDLPTAEYTITEVNIPVGYYADMNSVTTGEQSFVNVVLTKDTDVEVTCTNSYEPANLTVTKTVDVEEEGTNTPEVKDFEFTIEFPNGVNPETSYNYTVSGETGTKTATVTNGGMIISLEKGQTATFLNLPVGSYTVTETDYSAYGYDSNYKVNDTTSYTEGESANVTLVRDTTQAVEFLNKFPVGDLIIEKTVTKEFYGTAWSGDTFTFTVERTSKDLIVGNTYKLELDGTASGTATVLDNNIIEVTITFGAPDAATLKAEGESVTHTLAIKNLPAGTYSVKEETNGNYVQTPEGLIVSELTIPADEIKASFTNTVKRKSGNLYLEKELKILEGFQRPTDVTRFSFTIELLEEVPAEDKTFTVTYSSAQYTDDIATATSVTMSEGKFTVTLEADQNVTINGLPEGKYRITEATVPSYANSFAHEINENWVVQESAITDGQMYTEINVEDGATAKVKCTNTYPVDRAELIIQKLVTKEYDRDTLPETSFTFTVALNEEDSDSYDYKIYDANGIQVKEANATVTDKAFTVELKDGQYAVIPGMPVCGYSVSENENTADYNASYEVYVSETGDSASTMVNTTGAANAADTGASVSRTFSAGKTDTVVFTNEYKRHLGTLTISKTVEGGSADDTFIFHIKGTDASNSYIDMDVTITGSGSITIYDLPLGSYTVTEDTDWSWRYTATSADASPSLTADNLDATVTFTNTYTENRWLNFTTNMPNVFGKEDDEQEGS